MKIKISAIGKYLPGKPIHTEELVRNETPWTRGCSSGVETRHFAIKGKDFVSTLGAQALQIALENGQYKPNDLDLLIFAGASFDYPVPHTSVLIKEKICNEEESFNCFDIDATCLSFMQALEVAEMYIQCGKFRRIAIVNAEISSSCLDPDDPHTFLLFGDAATAVILEPAEAGEFSFEIIYADFKNYPSGAHWAKVPIGGQANRGNLSGSNDSGYFFAMDGVRLIRLTLSHLDDTVHGIRVKTGIDIPDFDVVITHQTSKFGNDYFKEKYKPKENSLYNTLACYGNCISASIPLGLESWHSDHVPGDYHVLLLGSAAGVTLSAMVLKFSMK